MSVFPPTSAPTTWKHHSARNFRRSFLIGPFELYPISIDLNTLHSDRLLGLLQPWNNSCPRRNTTGRTRLFRKTAWRRRKHTPGQDAREVVWRHVQKLHRPIQPAKSKTSHIRGLRTKRLVKTAYGTFLLVFTQNQLRMCVNVRVPVDRRVSDDRLGFSSLVYVFPRLPRLRPRVAQIHF